MRKNLFKNKFAVAVSTACLILVVLALVWGMPKIREMKAQTRANNLFIGNEAYQVYLQKKASGENLVALAMLQMARTYLRNGGASEAKIHTVRIEIGKMHTEVAKDHLAAAQSAYEQNDVAQAQKCLQLVFAHGTRLYANLPKEYRSLKENLPKEKNARK